MKVKNIRLINFRGFEDLEIKLQREVTVIAGLNGVGKSSILDALRLAYSRAIPRFTLGRYSPISAFDKDIRNDERSFKILINSEIYDKRVSMSMLWGKRGEAKVEQWSERLTKIPLELTEARRASDSKRVRELQVEIEDLEFFLKEDQELFSIGVADLEESNREFPKQDDGPDYGSLIDDRSADLDAFRNSENQPIFVYYSAHRSVYHDIRILPKTDAFDIQRAYDTAFEEREVQFRDFMHWFKWIHEHIEKTNKDHAFSPADLLLRAINDFLPEFQEIKLEELPRLRLLLRKNNIWLSLDQLSDGERGLLGLVMDIARRLILANPGAKDPLSLGNGIILIDEIELHLHPQWQRMVMKQLAKTFPSCQFIATSHSPQIIGAVDNESILLLKSKNGEVSTEDVNQSFGMESGWILKHIMGTSDRDDEVKAKFDALNAALSDKSLPLADELIQSIEKELEGVDPELQSLKSLLERYKLLHGRQNEKNK